MKKNELEKFSAFMFAIADLYGRKLAEDTVLLYFESLEDLELRAIRGAVRLHCQESRFFPLPADIREKIAPKKTALVAWSEVEAAMFRFGRYATVRFEDPVTNAVVRSMGGWPELCDADLSEPWTQKEFERRYEAYRTQRIRHEAPLPGLHERSNRACGRLDYLPDVVVVGDRGKVKLVPAPDKLEFDRLLLEASQEEREETKKNWEAVTDLTEKLSMVERGK